MNFKKITVFTIFFALLLTLSACSDKEGVEVKKEDVNPVVATVNGVDIREDFIDKTYDIWLFMKGTYDNNSDVSVKTDKEAKEDVFHYGRRESAIVKTNLLNIKIQGMVLEDYYKKQAIVITDEALENKYTEMIEIMKEKKPEVLEFYKKNKISEEFIKEGLKNNYYMTIFSEKLEEKFREEYDLSEKEYKNFKLNIEASAIFVDDEKTADEVYKKLQEGAKFEDLVQEYSIDEVSKNRGGNLGNMKLEEMPIEFVRNVGKMKKGEISKPFKTVFAYSIVKLNDFNTVKDMLEDENLVDSDEAGVKIAIYNRLFQLKLDEEINKIMKKANIEIKKNFYEEDLNDNEQ